MKQRGKDFQVGATARLSGLENISVGDHVYLAPGVVVLCGLDVTIEDKVMVAHNSVITDGNHTLLDDSYRYGARENRPVRIGAGSWIGANSTVVAGVTIGRRAVVGANSAVVRDVPDDAVFGGVPARRIGDRRALAAEIEREIQIC